MARRTAYLPLHGGKAPSWLFRRMHRLAGAITQLIVEDFGPRTMLDRLSDPCWFQAFGCVLGFDWHSSGLTTVTCGALGEAYRRMGADLGIHVAGGKGGASRKTPAQIADVAAHRSLDGDTLVYASRMSAKVDSAAVQDGYQLYTHHFFFTDDNAWAVVQQGMSDETGYARRYHWLSETTDAFVCEPHNAVLSPTPPGALIKLNMVASESDASRNACTAIAHENPDRILAECGDEPSLFMPAHHPVLPRDIDGPWLRKLCTKLADEPPETFEALLGRPGVGPKGIRSLALVAELLYNTPASVRDPATFSFAHGGKDGHPFPVLRHTYDQTIATLEDVVRKARINPNDKDHALYRLASFLRTSQRGANKPPHRDVTTV